MLQFSEVKLGDPVVDRISGFKGIVTGKLEYLTGCNQVFVNPRAVEGGKLVPSEWFDVQRMERDAVAQPFTLDNGETPGSMGAPPSSNR